ncbi:RND family efflux transporter, MFP subunit [Desulfatibacillum alkenivorans DSM 16219]|uniref:RND family efflux transporter, MFP subunit n=1 Tax=Desulfatibacillum alkenivorans DSM 16219 TaxID=1121393 RepID=A0A1M6TQZ8_9BACT|nr:efflux RND transporter periplasmic adaptor subunit [Desulfatibacillum alkenivorans]SHK59330.1 RND family efflux transporter, MFP subunit [Desulfatibacillum alkenivorans DSM 16219]
MTQKKHKPSFLGRFIGLITPIAIIVAGGAAWSYFKTTAPVMERAQPKRQVSVVETMPAAKNDLRTAISAMGTVTAAKEVTVKAQVSGTVLKASSKFVPGGIVHKGDVLLTLDQADYKVQVQKARSAMADAQAALAIEQGNQNIAREELSLLSELSESSMAQSDLALRKPQLAQAQAAVDSAEADLRQALLDLERTVIKAPFNAMIMERDVNVGTYVGAQDSLASLVGIDAFWIEAVVSLDQLHMIDLDHPEGCPVKIHSQAGFGEWDGKVIQVAGKLNDASRMATVIVEVENPMGGAEGPSAARLMIDDYVYAEITGRELPGVIEIPRSALQDDDAVWVLKDNALDIRKVSLAWKDADKVYISNGVEPGEQIVTSGLSTPVQGMPLQTLEAATPAAENKTEA